MAAKKRGAAAQSAASGGGKLAAHQQPVTPLKGKPPHMGGPTLAHTVSEIEAKFGKDNATPGLVARFGRKDIMAPDGDISVVTTFVEMVPEPDQVEKNYSVEQPPEKGAVKGKTTDHQHVIDVFDPKKLRTHETGDRTATHGATIEEAVAALAKKVGVGGAK